MDAVGEGMKTVKVVIGVLLGNIILAFAIGGFILPHDIIVGGATGLGMILHNYIGIDISIGILAVNVVLFFVGLGIMGWKFALTTIVSTCCFPLFLSFFRSIQGISELADNKMLAAVFGGLLIGLGVGIVLRLGSSTGGMDIPPIVLQKKMHIPVAISLYAFDSVILLAQVVFSGFNQILYGILVSILTSIMLNKVILLGQNQIQLFIISKEYMKIREVLLGQLDSGVTLVNIETGYDKTPQQGILCIISNRKLHAVNQVVQKIDEHAFITISHTNEVKGKGFSIAR